MSFNETPLNFNLAFQTLRTFSGLLGLITVWCGKYHCCFFLVFSSSIINFPNKAFFSTNVDCFLISFPEVFIFLQTFLKRSELCGNRDAIVWHFLKLIRPKEANFIPSFRKLDCVFNVSKAFLLSFDLPSVLYLDAYDSISHQYLN